MGKDRETYIGYKQKIRENEMSEKKNLYFDNFPEAKLALGKVAFPIVIKPYECNIPELIYKANSYSDAINYLYDAFEYSHNSWVVIESV